jgi:hypothetical protein
VATGQPWRAASLGGGGALGALPLGAAAADADAADPSGEQAEELAGEVEGGGAAARALWRWACFQAAERAGAAAEARGGAPHEAALYGALGCHVARVLPACSSWEDCCWAHLRCWLDAAVDSALTAAEEGGDAEAADGLLPADALAAAAAGGAAAAAAAEAAAVLRGGWPLARARDALAPTFQQALQAAVGGREAAAAGAGAAPAVARYRRVQAALVLGRVQELVCGALVGWIAGGGGGGGDDDAPACPPGLMRFAAHLALSLWALDIAEVAEG